MAESFKTVSSVSKTVSSKTITRPKWKRKSKRVENVLLHLICQEKKLYWKNYKYEWIGCEVESCKFWAHVACVGVDIGKNDDAKTVTFLCEEHK